MTKKSVPKADGIKQLRGLGYGGDTSGKPNPGDRPIRSRGYYRALKRREEWAIRLNKLPPLQRILEFVYSRFITEAVCVENPFLKLIPKHSDWSGKYVSLPIIFGKKDEDER